MLERNGAIHLIEQFLSTQKFFDIFKLQMNHSNRFHFVCFQIKHISVKRLYWDGEDIVIIHTILWLLLKIVQLNAFDEIIYVYCSNKMESLISLQWHSTVMLTLEAYQEIVWCWHLLLFGWLVWLYVVTLAKLLDAFLCNW